jgi:hypothetical protein
MSEHETVNIFEQAARRKLRWTTTRGQITVEELWDLPLQSNTKELSLDGLAVSLDTEIQGNGAGKSYLKKQRSTVDKDQKLRFDIVVHIIEVREQENEDRANSQRLAAEAKQLEEALEDRTASDLANLPKDKLEERLSQIRALQRGEKPATTDAGSTTKAKRRR